MNESSPNGGTATKPKERVSFSEVVRVHFRWADRFHDNKGVAATAKDELDAAREKFELHEGKIVDAYWCMTEASAVALTEKSPAPAKPRPFRRDNRGEPLAQTSLVQLDPGVKTFPFFVVVAFLAGFSERWAQVVLGGAEQTVRASIGGSSKST